MSAGRRVRDHVRAGGRVFTHLFERVIPMDNQDKRRMIAVVDEYGVNRWVLPRSRSAKSATLARIMRLAHETNAELPDLSASMPPRYARFADAHRTVQLHSDDAPDS